MGEWIKCSEKIPQPGEFILAYNGRNIPLVLKFFVKHEACESRLWFQQTLIHEGDGNESGSCFGLDEYPYWQPLPLPPEDA